jgi:sugar transferase EpsL
LKRLIDILGSAAAIVLLSPVFLVVAAIVRWKLGSPILFRQQRPGLGGDPFTLRKFRTMTDARNRQGDLLPDAQRLTPTGMWIRSHSLDEMPQLWNVLTGDMSLVGPRPLLMQYVDRYTPEQARRHLVKPGITGAAQMGGRNAISWEEKFALDTWYVDHQSLWLDLKIMVKTALFLVKREGIYQEGHVTMPEFMGTNKH